MQCSSTSSFSNSSRREVRADRVRAVHVDVDVDVGAAAAGAVRKLSRMIALGLDPKTVRSSKGWTLLHSLCASASPDAADAALLATAKLLLEHGADPSATTPSGLQPASESDTSPTCLCVCSLHHS